MYAVNDDFHRRVEKGMGMIKIFTTPDCPKCRAAKAWFKDRGQAFEEINVKDNMSGLRKMIRLSGAKTVPVIQVGEQVMIGFERAKLEEMLEQSSG